MKSKSKNNKLAFNKASVSELNDNQLVAINGGGDTINSGIKCLIAITTMMTKPILR
jgi:lactobin A/cerein 7B family class IIb bacteriocin